MTYHEKLRVAVLYGGRSGEHEISLLSAKNVIEYLDKSRFEVTPIGIDREGFWFLDDNKEKMLFDPECITGKPQSSSGLLPLLKKSERLFDVIFPAVHGTFCEDGTLQGLLELADVPYVGCGVLASAIGMDKDISKRLVASAGIKIAPYVTIKKSQWAKQSFFYSELINNQLKYPLFVKPANTGSSVGIEKIKHPDDLKEAVERAFQYDVKVLVEQGINAREIELAVLESIDSGADPIVSPAGEIIPTHEFYSYAAKYLDEKGAALVIPAELSDALQEKAKEIAKKIFAILECEGMARVDLFLDKETNEFYFNEINTIPGFTQISMYPKLMAASGIFYPDLLTHLVTLAVDRHAQKNKLCRQLK